MRLDHLATHHQDGVNLIEASVFEGEAYWWSIDWSYRYATQRNGLGPQALTGAGASEPVRRWIVSMADRTARHARWSLAQDAPRRLLYTGETLFWGRLRTPNGTIGPTDRFFHSMLEAAQDVGYQPASIFPVVDNLRSFSTLTDGFKAAREKVRHGFEHVPFERYLGHDEKQAARRAAIHFRRTWTTIEPWLDDVLEPIAPEIASRVTSFLEKSWKSTFPREVARRLACRKAVQAVEPQAVLVLQEYEPWEQHLIVSCQQEAVPVIAIQHGIMGKHHPGYAVPDHPSYEPDALHPRPRADATLVFGEHDARFLEQQCHYSRRELHVVGHPRSDMLYSWLETPREAAAKSLGIDPMKRWLVWLAQSHGMPKTEAIAYRDALTAAASQLGNTAVLVKPHPGETDLSIYQGQSDLHLMPSDADLGQGLRVAAAAITKNSTAAQEAMMFDVPAIVFNIDGHPDPVDYVQAGAAHGVHDLDQLLPALQAALNDDPTASRRREYILDAMGPFDGKTSSRCIAAIQRIIAGVPAAKPTNPG